MGHQDYGCVSNHVTTGFKSFYPVSDGRQVFMRESSVYGSFEDLENSGELGDTFELVMIQTRKFVLKDETDDNQDTTTRSISNKSG